MLRVPRFMEEKKLIWMLKWTGFLFGFVILFMLMSFSVQASANTFQVNTTLDTVDANPGNGVCADSNNKCSLRAAVMEANASAGADTIKVPTGTYTLTLTGAAEDAAATGDLDVVSAITFQGTNTAYSSINTDPSLVVIDGNNSDRIFDINPLLNNTGYNVSFQAMTFQNGNVPYDTTASNYGGGAIGADTGSAGTITFNNCVFQNNQTNSGDNGGGVFISGLAGGVANFQNTVFKTNTASTGGGKGGGIYSEGDLSLNVSNSTFDGNKADIGGGFYAQTSSASTGPATITNSTFSNNTANDATLGGGGLFLNKPATISETTISNNTAVTDGGGIFTDYITANSIKLTNVTMYNNHTGTSGGGLYDGIGTPLLHNTIVAGNTSGVSNTADNIYIKTATSTDIDATSSYNLIGKGNTWHTATLTNGTNGNILLTTNNPGLLALANNGGPTQTNAIAQGSPALDAGDNSVIDTTDQRGFTRKLDASDSNTTKTIDIGAYEAQPSIATAVASQSMSDNSTANVTVYVGDSSASTLNITATSSNQTLIPDANLHFSGTGGTRTLAITPAANQSGTATITLTVSTTYKGTSQSMSTTLSVTVNATPDLSFVNVNPVTFQAGQQGTYQIDVKNVGIASTSGKVTVTDTLPAGLTVASMSGSGWTCNTVSSPLTCTRSDALAAGATYPSITLTVNVSKSASSPLSNPVTVSTTGDTHNGNDSATYTTTVQKLPIITFGTNGNTTWSKSQSTTVTITPTSNPIDTTKVKYGWTQNNTTPPTGLTAFTSGDTITKSSGNGVWYLYVTASDTSANKAESFSNAFNIVNTPPSITLSSLPTTPTNGNVTVNVNATVTGTGNTVALEKWASGTQTTTYFAGSGTAFTGTTFSVNANGIYTVYVRDSAGNEAVNTISINNIDTTSPTISLTLSPTGLTNGSDTITVTASAYGSGNSVALEKWASGSQTVTYFAGSGTTFTGSTFTLSTNGTYTVYVKDDAGNEAVQMITINNIETIAPTVTLNPSTTALTNTSVTVTVNATVTGTGNSIALEKWASGSQTVTYFAGSGTTFTGSTISVNASGTYTVYVKDTAGNETVQTITINNIASQPVVKLSTSPTTLTTGIIAITVNTTLTGSGNSVALEKWASGSQTTSYFSGSGTTFTGTTFSVSTNGMYTVYVKDAVGNETIKTISVNNIAVPINLSLSATPTNPTNGNVTVTVSATLTGTGNSVALEKWASGTQTTTYFSGSGTTFTGTTLSVNANGIYTVYVQDTAGNQAVNTISINNIDTTSPTISLSSSPTGPTNGSVTVTVTTTVYGNGNSVALEKWASGSQVTAYFAGSGTTFTGSTFSVSANGTYTVYVKDAAGNEAVKTITINKIETKLPILSLTSSPAGPINGNVTVTVTATVYGNGNGVALEKWASGSQVAAYFAGSGTTITGSTFSVSANGTYTVYVKDAAGNEAVKTITINNIASVLTLSLTSSPAGPTNGSVTVTVTATVYGNGNSVALEKWASGSQVVTYFAGSGTTITGSVFAVSANGTYTVYVKDAAGNEAVKTITINNIASVPTLILAPSPAGSTNRNVMVTVTATIYGNGNSVALEKWASGSQVATYFAGSGTTITGSTFAVSANGTYTVYVKDAVGNEAVKTITINNIHHSTSNNSSPSTFEFIGLNGEQLSVDLKPSPNDKNVLIVNLPDGNIGGTIQGSVGLLNKLEKTNMQAILKIHSNTENYNLPISVLLDAIEHSNVNDSKAVISIKINEVKGEKADQYVNQIQQQGGKKVLQIIEYQVSITDSHHTQTMIENFDAYVSRSFIVQQKLDENHTVVLYYDESTKTWKPVPTFVEQTESGTVVHFQRRGNSIYALAQVNQTFNDIQHHWAKKDIEWLASKMIVKGINKTNFDPNASITRAQFTTLLVRGLGLTSTKTKSTDQQFRDVSPRAWYASTVKIAVHTGLIKGFDDGTFRPNETITREQMAVMMERAIEFTGNHEVVKDSSNLTIFKDEGDISKWAKQAVAQLVKDKLIQGETASLFAPNKTATRAEAVVLLKRMMEHVGFMN